MDKKIERVTLLHRVLKAARMGRTIDELEAEMGVSLHITKEIIENVNGFPPQLQDRQGAFDRH